MKKLVWGGTHWNGHKCERRTYYFDDGVLYFEDGKEDRSANRTTLLWFKELGYDSPLAASKADTIMNRCVGKTEDDLIGVICEYGRKLRERREKSEKDWEDWQILRNRFDGYVIGLDKDVDVYDTGFSVRVLLSAQKGFDERVRFVKENRNDFLRYVIGEIGDSKGVSRKIGDIGFYKPVETIILRVPEVEVKFEVKGG